MRSVLALCLGALLGLLLVTPLSAGPWPREKGSGFLSITMEAWESDVPDVPNYYTSTFVEYGLTERLTLGSKYAMGSEAGTLLDFRLGVSLDVPHPHALSLEFAIGQRDTDRFLLSPEFEADDAVTANFGSVGLAYGRGLSWGDRSGWFSTELHVAAPLGGDAPELGLGGPVWSWDTTLGLTLENDWKVMGQVFTTFTEDGRDIIKIAPGVAIPVGERAHIEIGARVLTNDLEGSALALGFWRQF